MATYTSQLHAVKIAIVDGLLARPNIISAGVQVTSAFVGWGRSNRESIQLAGEDDFAQQWAAIGRLSKDEELTLNGIVVVIQAGGGENVIRACRLRSFALLAELEAFIEGDPSIGNLVRTSNFVGGRVDEGVSPDGRICIIDWSLTTKNRLQSS